MKKFFICFDPVMGMVEVDKADYKKNPVGSGHYVKASDADLALSLLKDMAETNPAEWRPEVLLALWRESAQDILKELSA